MNVLSLSDDCLYLIFKELTLKEQLSMALACIRFENVAAYLWKTEYKDFCLDLFQMPLSETELKCFLKQICDTVKRIRIKYLDELTFDVFKEFKYKRLNDFRFSKHDFHIDDEAILTFAEILPNLSAFSPQGQFTGKYFNKLTNLKNLTLTHCYRLNAQYLEEILKSLELESLNLDIDEENCEITMDKDFKCVNTLQEIKINSDGLHVLFNVMMQLNQLRSIKVNDTQNMININDLFMQIFLHKNNKIISITTQYLAFNEKRLCELPSIKVHRLIFLDTLMKQMNFKKFEKVFTNLNELHFLQRYSYKNTQIPDLSYILSHCENLKLLNFQLSDELPWNLAEDTKNMLSNRKTPLKINVYPDYLQVW